LGENFIKTLDNKWLFSLSDDIQGSMEVYWAGVALSMETAYSLLLGDSVPVHHYHVFAHLCRLGYIVCRHSDKYVLCYSSAAVLVETKYCKTLNFVRAL